MKSFMDTAFRVCSKICIYAKKILFGRIDELSMWSFVLRQLPPLGSCLFLLKKQVGGIINEK